MIVEQRRSLATPTGPHSCSVRISLRLFEALSKSVANSFSPGQVVKNLVTMSVPTPWDEIGDPIAMVSDFSLRVRP